MIINFKIFEKKIEKHIPIVQLYVLYSKSNDKDNKVLFKDDIGGYVFLPSNTNNPKFNMVIFNDFNIAKKFVDDRPELNFSILPLR